jgi:hypothetical protein
MVGRGARNLILLSRTGPGNKHAQSLKAELEGARVETPACDISDIFSLERCLGYYQTDMPPIKGCIQATVVRKVG